MINKRQLSVINFLLCWGFWFCKNVANSHGQADHCRTLEFFPPLDGHALVNHVIKSMSLERQDACRIACYLDNDCLSYNFGRLRDGDFICQLSDSDHIQHPEDLEKSSGFIYRGTENACSRNPCSNHGKCKIDPKDNTYYCKCEDGSVGKYCKEATEPPKTTQSPPTATPQPPVDGNWSPWGAWGDCSTTCGSGTRIRERTCNNPAPAHGGAACVGDTCKTEACLGLHCSSSDPCHNYKVLNTLDRSVGYSSKKTVHCDKNELTKGWYRFTCAAGDKMPTKCVPKNHCGTHAPGWLSGNHPTVQEGIVTRKVCYHWKSNCCNWNNNIRIKNCGVYYVYELDKTPECNLRYCGNNPGQLTGSVSSLISNRSSRMVVVTIPAVRDAKSLYYRNFNQYCSILSELMKFSEIPRNLRHRIEAEQVNYV